MTERSNGARRARKAPAELKALFIGGGIGSLSGAAFLIRDGGVPGENILVLEQLNVLGGSCDGIGTAEDGYVLRAAAC